MVKICFTIALLIWFIIPNSSVFAQSWLGYNQSNFSGVNRITTNPAEISDNVLKFDLLVGIQTLDLSSVSIGKYFDFNSIPIFPTANSLHSLESDANDMFENSISHSRDVQFAFMVSLNKKFGLGLSLRSRAMVNFANVNSELVEFFASGSEDKFFDKEFRLDNYYANLSSWFEYGVTVGGVLFEKERHMVKVGGTFKILSGKSAASLHIDELAVNFQTESLLNTLSLDLEQGHTTDFANYLTNVQTDGANLLNKPSFGIDFGIVYEYRPNFRVFVDQIVDDKTTWFREKKKYRLKVSLALTDVGKANYTLNSSILDLDGSIGQFEIDGLDKILFYTNFDPENTSSSFGGVYDSLEKNFSTHSKSDEFLMQHAAKLNFEIDFKLSEKAPIYLSMAAYIDINEIKNKRLKSHWQQSRGMLNLRYESKWFGLNILSSILTSDGTLSSNYELGFALILGPLSIGSANIVDSYLINGNSQFVTYYAAAKIPIYFKSGY